MLAVVWPVLHWYDVAPLAVSVLDPPGQMDEGEAVADTFGKGLTVTVRETDFEQPDALVPVTE